MSETEKITGDETRDELKMKCVELRRVSLGASALIRVIDRFLEGKLSATELQELGDLLESDYVDYEDSNGDGVIAQVLFEMSSPEVNADIDRPVAERWRTMLSSTT